MPEEAAAAMPWDKLAPALKITSTRAITVDAPPEEVWAWLVQIGQGRGGFYSYDALGDAPAHCHLFPASRWNPCAPVLAD